MTTSPIDPHRRIIDTLANLRQDTADPAIFDVIAILSDSDLRLVYDAATELRAVIEQAWADRDDPSECENCATPIARDNFGRPRKFCSDACRQSAYRARRR